MSLKKVPKQENTIFILRHCKYKEVNNLLDAPNRDTGYKNIRVTKIDEENVLQSSRRYFATCTSHVYANFTFVLSYISRALYFFLLSACSCTATQVKYSKRIENRRYRYASVLNLGQPAAFKFSVYCSATNCLKAGVIIMHLAEVALKGWLL